MSLERKDIRAKLDPEYHEALARIASSAGLDIGEFVEGELVRLITERLHRYIKDDHEFGGLGLTGKIRERSGTPGRGGKR